MKDYLAELIRAAPTPAHGRNVAREYLQARILGALQRAGAMVPLAFHGGTALRFLFASARLRSLDPGELGTGARMTRRQAIVAGAARLPRLYSNWKTRIDTPRFRGTMWLWSRDRSILSN